MKIDEGDERAIAVKNELIELVHQVSQVYRLWCWDEQDIAQVMLKRIPDKVKKIEDLMTK